MADRIKGITIEFRGNATPLQKAIREVDSALSKTTKELSSVNKALKFNPTSVELWRQKQQLLTQKVNETKTKLDALKQAQKQMDASGVDKTSEEYRKLQRQIIETGSQLKTFQSQLREVGNANLKALSEQFKQIGNKTTEIGRTMTTRVTAPIVAGFTAATKYASDYEENLNKIDVAFGNNAQSVKDWANTARTAYGLSKVQATQSASAFGALAKGIGLTDKEAAGMSTTLAGLSADLGSYFNVGTDESAKALEGIFTGESEALKRYGVVMTDTNLQQFAADQGLVWKEMDQTEKTMLRYQYVLAKTKDAQGDFARTSDGTANSTKIFKSAVQDLATAIGTNLLPIVTPIIQKITEWINKFNELSPETQKIITIIGVLAATIGPLLLVIGKVATGISAVLGLVSTISGALAGAGGLVAILTGPVGIALAAVVVAIGAVIGIMKLWKKHGDSIKEFFRNFGQTIKSIWESVKQSISNAAQTIYDKMTWPFRKAWEIIQNIVEKIKGFFPIKIGDFLGKIKLPHLSIDGKFSLNPPEVPHINVDWYDKGGIFNSPTVVGVGEKRPEFVGALDDLRKIVREESGYAQAPVINIYPTPYQSPREIAIEVQRELVALNRQGNLAHGII